MSTAGACKFDGKNEEIPVSCMYEKGRNCMLFFLCEILLKYVVEL